MECGCKREYGCECECKSECWCAGVRAHREYKVRADALSECRPSVAACRLTFFALTLSTFDMVHSSSLGLGASHAAHTVNWSMFLTVHVEHVHILHPSSTSDGIVEKTSVATVVLLSVS